MLLLLASPDAGADPALAPGCGFPPVDTQSRPAPEQGPTEVKVRLYLLDIPNIDDVDQSFVADIFFRFAWRDPRLAREGTATCVVPLSKVWHPALLILNRRKVEEQMAEVVSVLPDGTVYYRQRYYGTFSAPIDLRQFPFDRQRLPVNLIAPVSLDEMVFVADPSLFGMEKHISIANWRIGQPQASSGDYEVTPEQVISALAITFPAQRRAEYYVWKLIIPMSMVVFMSWAVFWISPLHIAPRIGLSATSMLTLIAFRLALGNSLPPIPYLTLLDRFTVGVTIIVFAALLQAIATTAVWDQGQEGLARRFNRVARVLFPLAFLLVAVVSFG